MKKNKLIMYKIENIYNMENKPKEELKILFNKKFFKIIFDLEKNTFYEK